MSTGVADKGIFQRICIVEDKEEQAMMFVWLHCTSSVLAVSYAVTTNSHVSCSGDSSSSHVATVMYDTFSAHCSTRNPDIGFEALCGVVPTLGIRWRPPHLGRCQLGRAFGAVLPWRLRSAGRVCDAALFCSSEPAPERPEWYAINIAELFQQCLHVSISKTSADGVY